MAADKAHQKTNQSAINAHKTKIYKRRKEGSRHRLFRSDCKTRRGTVRWVRRQGRVISANERAKKAKENAETQAKLYLNESEDLLQFQTLFRLFSGRLDERIDEQRIFGDALSDEQNAFGDSFLLAQRVHRALADEGREFAVLFDQLLVHGHGFLVAAAKFAVQPPGTQIISSINLAGNKGMRG